LVSALAYPISTPGRIIEAWRNGKLDVALSRYILDETARVLSRLPRVQLNEPEIRDLVDSLILIADIVGPDAEIDPQLRDPADQAILATLRASGVDWLITGDKDLGVGRFVPNRFACRILEDI
jgi:putative PIN family toxin of toxin-antitoxin system